ncbi:hypothetical protein HaLaN_06141, partial [Haematococcus lacustris]
MQPCFSGSALQTAGCGGGERQDRAGSAPGVCTSSDCICNGCNSSLRPGNLPGWQGYTAFDQLPHSLLYAG